MARADAAGVESLIVIAMLCLIGRIPQEINTCRAGLHRLGDASQKAIDVGYDRLST